MTTESALLGVKGEDAAEALLLRHGYEILERNWFCEAGEADIIALDEEEDGDLVFVEVKTRRGAEKGYPSEAVDAKKRARYEKIAAWYLTNHDPGDRRIRFDIICVLVLTDDKAMIRHYKNAFASVH